MMIPDGWIQQDRIAQLESDNAELLAYKAEADALRADNQRLRMADCDKTHAELRARLEDAELIAWGLARAGRGILPYISTSTPSAMHQCWPTIINDTFKPGEAHEIICPAVAHVWATGRVDWHPLTPEAREALRNAKKEAGA